MRCIEVKTLREAFKTASTELVAKEFGISIERLSEIKDSIESDNPPDEALVEI